MTFLLWFLRWFFFKGTNNPFSRANWSFFQVRPWYQFQHFCGITYFLYYSNMHLGILSAGIENGGHWPWHSRSLDHFICWFQDQKGWTFRFILETFMCLFIVTRSGDVRQGLTLLMLEMEYSGFGGQYHACWCPGDFRSFSRHGIDGIE